MQLQKQNQLDDEENKTNVRHRQSILQIITPPKETAEVETQTESEPIK